MSPSDEAQPTLAHAAQRALNHSATIVTLIVRAVLAEYLRPGIRFTPGVPAEADPISFNGPPRHLTCSGVWRPL